MNSAAPQRNNISKRGVTQTAEPDRPHVRLMRWQHASDSSKNRAVSAGSLAEPVWTIGEDRARKYSTSSIRPAAPSLLCSGACPKCAHVCWWMRGRGSSGGGEEHGGSKDWRGGYRAEGGSPDANGHSCVDRLCESSCSWVTSNQVQLTWLAHVCSSPQSTAVVPGEGGGGSCPRWAALDGLPSQDCDLVVWPTSRPISAVLDRILSQNGDLVPLPQIEVAVLPSEARHRYFLLASEPPKRPVCATIPARGRAPPQMHANACAGVCVCVSSHRPSARMAER